MKREKYDLADEEFAFFVTRVGEQLTEREIPYIVVGGTAVQAHMLSGLCGKYQCDIEDLVVNDHVRLQDHIRATDDVDMAWKMPSKIGDVTIDSRIILSALDSFCGAYESPSQNHVLEYSLDRRGIKRPRFRVRKDGKGNEDDVIAMNIGRADKDLERFEPNTYYKFIAEGETLTIPYCEGFDLVTRVIKPEHLVAAKLSNFRPKDLMDLQNLYQCFKDTERDFDFKEIEDLLGPNYHQNLAKFMNLIKE